MSVRVLVLLVGLLLFVPGVVGSSSAAFPQYFSAENAALVCGVASDPFFGTIAVLVQINFDPVTNGGISLPRADQLFSQLLTGIGALGPIIGQNFQVVCSYPPSTIKSFGLNALTLAQFLAPNYQGFGFSLFTVLDAYYWQEASFLGGVSTLRVDAFVVTAPSTATFEGSASVLKSLIP